MPLSSRAQPVSGSRPAPELPPPTMPPNEPNGGAAQPGTADSADSRATAIRDTMTLRFMLLPPPQPPSSSYPVCETSETAEGRGPLQVTLQVLRELSRILRALRGESQSLAFFYRLAARQPFEVGLDEARQARQVVPPFEQRQHAAAADLGGELAQPSPPAPEPLLRHPHAAEGVVPPGVETGGEDQGVGGEAAKGGEDPVADRLLVDVVAGAGGERHVEREPLAGADPPLARRAGAGVEGVLVGAGVEDVGARLEEVLGAVAVMDVEIEDRHPRGAVAAAQALGGHRGAVEEAEAHGHLALGVVARRAPRREGRAPAAGPTPGR